MTIPRVSIVIPVFNALPFLEETVASVRSQSFTDWELLLVDDGSTDGGRQRAEELAREDPRRVRCFGHSGGTNRGISASLNLGIAEARGSLVALLDADDVWLPGKLEEQVRLFESNPTAAMVYGPSQFWHSWTGKAADQPRDRVERLGVSEDRLIEPPELLIGMLRGRVPVPCPSSVLVSRDALRRVGGFEETAVANSHSDQSLYVKLFLREPVFASGRCRTRYRQHAASSVAVSKKLGTRERERRALLEWFDAYLRRSASVDPHVRQALDAQLSEARYRTSSRTGRLRRQPVRTVKGFAKRSIPKPALDALRRVRDRGREERAVGAVRFGDLRRLNPLSRRWGYDRGLPVDRYYIENFLERQSTDVRGNVMEIGDDSMTWRFGGEAVVCADVLNVAAGDPKTTLVGDLAAGDGLPSERFDCIIFTETLHLLYDFRAGLRTLHRMLKPGGVLLATFPGITKVGRPDDWGSSWYWSFTSLSARRLFDEVFVPGAVQLEQWGNVLSATAFLWGLAAEELEREELEYCDPEFPVTITVRAVKAGGGR